MSELTISGLIYVVDNNDDSKKSISIALKENGFEVHEFASGIELMDEIKHKSPDVILLDWDISPMDGLTVCGRIKIEKVTKSIPVIMTSNKSDEMDCILAFEVGVDDYIKRPFSIKELVARVRAMIRRKRLDYGASELLKDEIITIGDLKINLANRTVVKNSKFLNLTMKEFDLLVNLIIENSKVMTRQQLMSKVWSVDFCGDARTVDVHIRYLRQKVEDESNNPKYIKTVRGIGYRFASDEELYSNEEIVQ